MISNIIIDNRYNRYAARCDKGGRAITNGDSFLLMGTHQVHPILDKTKEYNFDLIFTSI